MTNPVRIRACLLIPNPQSLIPVKFVDEYRDAATVRRLADAIHNATTRPWSMMEICGGQTHAILRFGARRNAASGDRLDSRAGLSRMCDADRDARQGRGDCLPAGSDLLLLRRHAPRARLAHRSTHGEVGRARRADRVFADGCSGAGPATSRAAGGFLRRGLRDHRAGQRHGRSASGQTRFGELLGVGFARARAAGDAGRAFGAREPRAGLFGRRTRLHRYRSERLRADCGRVSRAHRCNGLRAGRHPPGHFDVCSTVGNGTARRGKSVRPLRPAGRQPRGLAADGRGVSGGAAEIARESARFRPAVWGCGMPTRNTTPIGDFGVEQITAEEPTICIAGQILQGHKKPHECPAFATRCTPERPLGAPMVSSEGACAAYYRYRRRGRGT